MTAPVAAAAASATDGAGTHGYYGRPVLKKPVWKPIIAAYFFTGGLAGASSTLALGARLTGRHRLARSARLVSLAGLAIFGRCADGGRGAISLLRPSADRVVVRCGLCFGHVHFPLQRRPRQGALGLLQRTALMGAKFTDGSPFGE